MNTLTSNDLSPHEFLLKHNCPIKLLRNLELSKGLCNDTCLTCHVFNLKLIDAEISVGDYNSKRILISRITFLLDFNESSEFPFKRTQFSIRLNFVMTINKSHGQTLDFVKIYLPHLDFLMANYMGHYQELELLLW